MNTIFLEVHGFLIVVSGLGLQRILMAINRMRHDIRALIVIRIPVSISIDVILEHWNLNDKIYFCTKII